MINKYERKDIIEDPSMIKTLMNLKVVEINSNERFTIYRCEDG